MKTERYSGLSPRITSQYSLSVYGLITSICDRIDFRNPIFKGRKRNRSLGSAQALIVEIALTDDHIRPILQRKLAQLMEDGGDGLVFTKIYTDSYNLK